MRKSLVVLFVCLSVLLLGLLPASAAAPECDPATDYAALGDSLADSDFSAAADAYFCALVADPTNVDLQIGRLNALVIAGRLLEAGTPFFTLQRFYPDAFDQWVADWRAVVEADVYGDNGGAARALALAAYYGFGQEGDVELMEKALAGRTMYFVLLANDLLAQDQLDIASELLEEAEDYTTPQELGWLAETVAYGLGDTGRGIAIVNSAIEQLPNVGALYHMRGYFFLNRDGDVEAALADIDRAIELEPLDPNYLVGRWSLNLGSDIEASKADLVRIAALVPEGNRILAAISSATADVDGDVDGAVQIFEDYVAFHTDNADVVVDGGALISGETVSADMVFGRVVVYTFEAAAGDTVTVTAFSPVDGVDTQVLVAAPDGTGIALNDDRDADNEDWNSEVTFTAPADGTYTLLVTHAGGNQEGAVEVTVTIDS